ncbi:PEBP family protein [Hydrogenophaga sp. PAMC20947]|nr:PEBP family protein [Hydrogenophaga sp. PAMC20947]
MAGACLAASLPFAAAAGSFKAEVWADNWFSLHVGERFVGEDSVSITTERSFNAETLRFEADYPLVLNFTIKDFKQDDTGLEYIGSARQQIGDGGFIMQITDTATQKVVAVSSSAFKCRVIHKAPLIPSCASSSQPTVASCGATIIEEPANWKAAGFDTSAWQSATVYSAADIGAKDGYHDIAWDPAAKLIWGTDLKSDNTLLCKLTVNAP